MLELRLLGTGAIRRRRQRIHTGQGHAGAGAAAYVFRAPMHRHESLAHADFMAGLQWHDDGATFAGDVDQVALLQQPARHILRVHLDRRLGHMAEQTAQRAGSAHTVPLVTQSSGGQ